MRRRSTVGAALAALLAGTVLAGCAARLPEGVDRALTDDWAKVAQVQDYVPEVGRCLDVVTQETGRYTDLSVDCASLHYGETVHVGRFRQDATRGPRDYAAAYAECDAKSREYMGRPWTDGLFYLRVAAPTAAAWDGGARWFKCDVIEVSSVTGGSNWVKRTGSLKAGIPAALLLGCGKYDRNRVTRDTVATVPCASGHNAEFAGMFRAAEGTSYPQSDRQWDVIYRQCRTVIGRFLGASAATAERWGAVAYPLDAQSWAAGDRLVRCWIWLGAKTMKKSAAGSKGKGLPSW